MSSDNTDLQLSVQKQLETLFSQHNLKTDTQLLAQVYALVYCIPFSNRVFGS
jgi:hypothetical protein